MTRIWVGLILGLGLFSLVGCTSMAVAVVAPAVTATAEMPSFATSLPSEALPRLVEAERQASIDRNLGLLAQLWAEDSRIVDGRGTQQPEDDYIWAGRTAILDRYVVAVFPSPPPPLTLHGALSFQVTGDVATARYGQDRWRFVKRANRWWLAELRYSQP